MGRQIAVGEDGNPETPFDSGRRKHRPWLRVDATAHPRILKSLVDKCRNLMSTTEIRRREGEMRAVVWARALMSHTATAPFTASRLMFNIGIIARPSPKVKLARLNQLRR